jgi:hypothetical protein
MTLSLTQTILGTANVDAINNFTRKMDDLKRKRDDLKVTTIATVFFVDFTLVDWIYPFFNCRLVKLF